MCLLPSYGKQLTTLTTLLIIVLLYMLMLSSLSSNNYVQCENMLTGVFVGDAATMPVHWIYNQKELRDSIESSSVLFHSPPICPYYTYPKGTLSPYGDESIPLINSMVSDPSFVFTKPRAVQFMLDFFKKYQGRLSALPKDFLNTKGKSSSDDIQAHGIVKVPLIVARYYNSPEVYKKVHEMVSIMQVNVMPLRASCTLTYILLHLLNDNSGRKNLDGVLQELMTKTTPSPEIDLKYISIACDDELIIRVVNLRRKLMVLANSVDESIDARRVKKILNAVVKRFFEADGTLTATIEHVKNDLNEDELDALNKAMTASMSSVELSSKGKDVISTQEVLETFGLSCSLPSVFIGALYIARKYWYDLGEALKQNALSGGDNCARAMIIGGVIGAMKGTIIPQTLIEGMSTRVRDVVVKKTLEICQ